MRFLYATVTTVCLAFATASFAQTTPPSPTAPAAAAAPAAATPATSGKRSACRTASQAIKGQEGNDQMQLCMAQAHLDCLKQAIDQRIVGPQRKEFIKSCLQ
jgi:hypothetical protein